jgi:integrase
MWGRLWGVKLPKITDELSALDVKRLTHPGGNRNVLVSVGGVPGLHLQLTPKRGRSWVLRAKIGEARRDIGLGGFPAVTLSQARQKAREARELISQGVDPIEERKAAKAALATAQRRGLTFADATDKYLAAKLDAFSNPKHRQQWRNTLETYAKPELGKMLVQDITVQDVLRVLQPIWMEKTETASRLRGRIEAVLSWATVAGHRTGDNPARWAGNLKELLPAPSKVAPEENQPAIQIEDAPRWFAALREQALWIIPAARMKMKKEHRVPLSPEAVALLQALPRLSGNPLIFPAARGGQLSDMTLSAAMKRMHKADIEAGGAGFVDRENKRPAVPHGLRSTFRDWVGEKTTYPGDMAEVALAHKINNAVEASYRRGDMIERRYEMMSDWSAFLASKTRTGKIIKLGKYV